MATIKAYTDLSQSKVLAEILPLETTDMIWVLANPDLPMIRVIAYEDSEKSKYYEILPAWSLAALLGVLPNENMLVKTTDGEYYCLAKDVMTKHYYNPIDACVAMIEKLHELNLL